MSEVLLPPSVPRFCDHAATLRRIWVWTEPGSSAPLPPPHLSLPAVTSSRSLRPPEQRRRGSTREGRQRGQTKGASLSQGQPGAHGLLPARRGRTCRGSPALQHCGPGLRQPLLRREQSRTAAARTHRGATGGLPPPGGPRRPKNDRNGPIRAAAPGPPGCPAQPPPPLPSPPPIPLPGLRDSDLGQSPRLSAIVTSLQPQRHGAGGRHAAPRTSRGGESGGAAPRAGRAARSTPPQGTEPAATRTKPRRPPAAAALPRPSAAPPPPLRAAPDSNSPTTPHSRDRARPPLPDGSAPGRREGRRPAASSSSAGGAGQCRALTYRPPPAPPRAGPAGSCRPRGRPERPAVRWAPGSAPRPHPAGYGCCAPRTAITRSRPNQIPARLSALFLAGRLAVAT